MADYSEAKREYDYIESQNRTIQEGLNMGKMLLKLCHRLQNDGMLDILDSETRRWYNRRLDEEDLIRQQRERQTKVEGALSKLTDEEKKLLGLKHAKL